MDIRRLALGATVVAGFTYAMWTAYGRGYDDAWIVARYVRQLVGGNGWAFNVGETWNAASSPLHVALAAPVALAGVPAHAAAAAVPAVVLAVGAWCLGVTLVAEGRVAAAVATPITLFGMPPVRMATGMETQLFVGLLLMIMASAMRGRVVWPLIGALILTRPEGAAVAVLMAAVEWGRTKQVPVTGLARAGAVILPWALFATWRFGSPLPDSVEAKDSQGETGIWPLYGSSTNRHLEDAFGSIGWVVLALAVIGIVGVVRRWGLPAAVPAAAVVVQHGVYMVAGAPDYPWYYVPLLAMAAVVAVVGVEWRSAPAYVVPAAVMLQPMAAVEFTETSARGYRLAASVADRLGAKTVAAAEAGVIAYELPDDVRFVDLIGLVSPNPPGYVDARFFENEPPDVVIAHDSDLREPGVQPWPVHEDRVVGADWFDDRYELVGSFPERVGQNVVVFALRDLRGGGGASPAP